MAHAKPRVTIPINPYVLTDIAACISLADELPRILETASSVGPCATTNELAEKVASALSLDSHLIEGVFRVIGNFSTIQDKADIDAEYLVSNITAKIEEKAPRSWNDSHLKRWQRIVPDIVGIISSIEPNHAIIITSKAQTLTYTQQSLLHDAKIITDVRPIFNHEADDVVEFIVSHSLVLRCLDGKNESQIHISIDAADIEQIRKICDRAIEKSNTLLKVFSNLQKKVVVVGKEDA